MGFMKLKEMAPQSTTSISAPVSPSVLHKQPKSETLNDHHTINGDDDHAVNPNAKKGRSHNNNRSIIKSPALYPLSRQPQNDDESTDESLSMNSSDNNLIDLNSEKSLQSTPKLQGKKNDTANVSSDIMNYQSNESSSAAKNDTNDNEKDHNDIDERGNPAACIFVASLTKGKNDEELNVSVSKHFEQWGDLLNVKVLKDWMGRPYAFVQFERTQDAKKALQNAPGTVLDGRNIRCEPARVNRTLSISSCGPSPLMIEEIETELAAFGKVEDITMIHGYPISNGNVGEVVFVKYCYRDDAVKAFLTLSKMTQKWWVEWASNLDTAITNRSPATNPSGSTTFYNNNNDIRSYGTPRGDGGNNHGRLRSTTTTTNPEQQRDNVFIGNLFDDVTEDELRERFNPYGTIHNLRIIRKTFPFKRVFAFIRFKEDAEAKKAIDMENDLDWHDKKLRVAYREPRDPALMRFGQNRRITMERPHPPGLGFPASDHQYLVSNTSNNSKNNNNDSTLTISSTTSSSPIANGRSTTSRKQRGKNKNSNPSSPTSTTQVRSTPSSPSTQENNGDSAALNNMDCHEEKTETIDDEQRQQQIQEHKIQHTPSTQQQQHRKYYNKGGNGRPSFADNIYPSSTTMAPPLHIGMNGGYLNPGEPLYHQHPHYMLPSTAPMYDPTMYPILNTEDLQQQPMMFGSMQDAGTTIEGITGGGSANKNGVIYVPGYYDYTGVYYGPYYHSVLPATTAASGLPPPLASSATSASSPVVAGTSSNTGTLTTASAINGMFGNGTAIPNNQHYPHHQHQQRSNMRQSSMSNTSTANNGPGYYYMMPPPLAPHHPHTMYHSHQSGPPLGAPTGPNAYMYPQCDTRISPPGYNTTMPINERKKDDHNKHSKQPRSSMDSSSKEQKNGRSNKKITISSPPTSAGSLTTTTDLHKN
ncbi:hypothetical protein BDA99DRAFT_575447 [Phascolomyces articulosus]|uniref:RRM domain-containing protein n=1 Tax=Phascolomyces articulosus TaxID=60185 RepID=A0AAD5K1G8_9FUNG|nr:hypothetical protein BDA99DRAFT_575447 [Phascolomyces articulosus]